MFWLLYAERRGLKGEVCHDGDEVKLFQDVILRDSVEINTAPKSIFDYLLHIMSMRKHMKEEGGKPEEGS